jgi:hypothetical protein
MGVAIMEAFKAIEVTCVGAVIVMLASVLVSVIICAAEAIKNGDI